MRRWNLPQVNTKVMCAVLTAAMVMTGFTACGGTTSAGTESAASESAEQKETIVPESTTEQSTVEQSAATESGEEKVEFYLGQITAIDGNVISIALAEKPEAPDGEAPTGEAHSGEAPTGDKPDGPAPDGNGGAPNGEAPSGEKPDGQAPDGNGGAPNGEKPTGEAQDGQKPEKDMLDEMTLTLSGDTMTITVNDDTIITIDGADATLDDLQVGDTVSFFLDGEVVTSLSVGMPEPAQPGQPMQVSQNPCHFFRRLGSGFLQPGLYDTDTTGNDEGTEIFIVSIGLRTFQKAESALFDLVLQAVNEGEISMGTDHDSGEISVTV